MCADSSEDAKKKKKRIRRKGPKREGGGGGGEEKGEGGQGGQEKIGDKEWRGRGSNGGGPPPSSGQVLLENVKREKHLMDIVTHRLKQPWGQFSEKRTNSSVITCTYYTKQENAFLS